MAIHAAQAVQVVENPSTSSSCSTICEHLHDPNAVESIGGTIENSISNEGSPNIILGRKTDQCAGYHEASTIWNLWAKSYEAAYGSSIAHITESGSVDDRVCIDKATLAKLTAAASGCHSRSGHGSNVSGGMHFPGGDEAGWGGSTGGGGTYVPPEDHHEEATVNTGGKGGNTASGGKSAGGSDTGTTSTTTWGHGNVNSNNLCFRIKDKRTDRYLTTYGSEYAYASLPSYYSVFRAYPKKSVEGGYTLTEINRNGGTVNYPVKINSALGQFKPLYGDKDAVFTFSPANFGDSCWGVPGKKMSRRHDWGGWGDNYRQASSGDDCADVELEEADC
ncbi:hypothetical protein PRZ48_005518 [Zasmidium cellare]|uniref:Uncharacterized protein n=1 Tax=Zasmidium cellare TaxID=395010 RepID=A0ABR0ESN0_ZASCE|nr:hypothetical protein PRZ48_005518 [Zasmidium cellare]